MKKIFLVLAMFLILFNINAQELSPGLQAKNDGNDAYINKDYVTAIKHWETYLNSGEEEVASDANTPTLYTKSFLYAANGFLQDKDYSKALEYFTKYLEKDEEAKSDGKIAYTIAYCNYELDKNAEAIGLFEKAIKLEYKEDYSMFYLASIYKKLEDEEKMKAILIEALDKYPTSKIKQKLVALLVFPLLREAAEPFNEANELAKVATSSDPSEYLANMGKAVTKFEVAKPLFEVVLKYDPNNDQASTYLKNCVDNISQYEEYKKSLEKK